MARTSYASTLRSISSPDDSCGVLLPLRAAGLSASAAIWLSDDDKEPTSALGSAINEPCLSALGAGDLNMDEKDGSSSCGAAAETSPTSAVVEDGSM